MRKNKSEYIFVYGTLMKRFKHSVHKLMLENAKYIGKAKTRGNLFEVNQYPAMIKNNTKCWVYGELYLLFKAEDTLKMLDTYEEVGSNFPEPNEYYRDIFEVYTEDGQAIKAWIYIYNLPINHLQKIESGDYYVFMSKD